MPPPENDNEARRLAASIRKWISDGRPKPKETTVEEEAEEKEEMTVSEDEKPKKKRSLFGWGKK